MKFKKLAALTLAGAMSLSLAACGGGGGGDTASPAPNTGSPSAATDTPAPEGEVYKIGVLAPEVTHGWSAGVAYYAEKRCDELVAEGKIEKKILISGDAAEMTTQLDELKTWGATPSWPSPVGGPWRVPIQQAIDEGSHRGELRHRHRCRRRVPRVRRQLRHGLSERPVHRGQDRHRGHRGHPGRAHLRLRGRARKQGFTEHMAELAPDMNLIEYATEFTREAGLADMADILTANSQIDAVFSMDDETSIGVLQAIRDAGRTDIKVITGGGGAQEWFNMMLADENQDIWLQSALYSPDMVEDAVDMALDILNGNAPEDPVKIIPTTILDRDTVESHLDENSPY